MNYIEMFKDVGVMDNDFNFLKHGSFDNDNNCQKSLAAFLGVIDEVYTFNYFTTDLYDFSIELKNLYTEVGVNLGCLFIERHYNREIRLNSYDTDKLEMRMLLNLNFYFDMIFKQTGDIKFKYDMGNLLSGLQNKILFLQHELVVEYGVLGEAINFVLNSTEFRDLSYFVLKTGFKCGFFWCLYLNTLYKQLSKESGKLSSGKFSDSVDFKK